jgi:hypothetical protein
MLYHVTMQVKVSRFHELASHTHCGSAMITQSTFRIRNEV